MGKKRWYIIPVIILIMILNCGCQNETSDIILEEKNDFSEPEVTDDVQNQENTVGDVQNQGKATEDVQNQENTIENAQNQEKAADNTKNQNTNLIVDVCGAVNVPGVYELEAGSRVYQALEKAGGLREDAAAEMINQAALLTDGQQIRIYTVEEQKAGIAKIQQNTENSAAIEAGEMDLHAEKININTADKAQLETLPGIGSSRALAIIAYREEHGAFTDVEQIQNVQGIKTGIYQKLKDQISID